MDSQRGHECESCALDEFLLSRCPFRSLLMGEGCFVKQVAATLITHIPRIKVFNPPIHLQRTDFPGVVDHTGQDARFVDSGAPYLLS